MMKDVYMGGMTMYGKHRKTLSASVLAVVLGTQIGLATEGSPKQVQEVHNVNVTANRM